MRIHISLSLSFSLLQILKTYKCAHDAYLHVHIHDFDDDCGKGNARSQGKKQQGFVLACPSCSFLWVVFILFFCLVLLASSRAPFLVPAMTQGSCNSRPFSRYDPEGLSLHYG